VLEGWESPREGKELESSYFIAAPLGLNSLITFFAFPDFSSSFSLLAAPPFFFVSSFF
jgi:hypothetical protein